MTIRVASDSVQGTQLRIETPSGATRLAVVARGDFDGDGWDDVLLRVVNRPRGGTLTIDDLVLLTRRTAGVPLHIVDIR